MISRVVALSLFNNLFFNTTKILKIIMFEWILFIIYKKKKDFKKNEKEFNKLGFNLNFIKETLSSYNYNYFDKNLSWHYHILGKKKNSNFSENKEKCKIFFFIKRCNRFNAIGKKFISLSYKL